MPKRFWRTWAKALGEKAHSDDREADKVAIIRTILAVINIVTCLLISTNIIIGWLT